MVRDLLAWAKTRAGNGSKSGKTKDGPVNGPLRCATWLGTLGEYRWGGAGSGQQVTLDASQVDHQSRSKHQLTQAQLAAYRHLVVTEWPLERTNGRFHRGT